MTTTRRAFLKTAAGSALISGIGACNRESVEPAKTPASIQIADADESPAPEKMDPDWLKAEAIRSAIVVPSFPEKIFDIVEFGAKGGAENDATAAIAAAVKACNAQGGGRVLVPPGVFNSGAVQLLSDVELHLAKGATLKFIPDPKRYLPAVLTRWEGLELMGYSPLIYAYKKKNIAVTGEGTLDGSANKQTWWPWKGEHSSRDWDLVPGQVQQTARNKLMADAEAGVPVEQRLYADGAYLRPPLFQPHSCENVLVEGVIVKDSPFWLLHPVLCNSVTVRGVTLESHGPNSDGCNPESCDHVLIENCTFNTGDDCIAIKSGRNADGRRINVPSKNILIANCKMRNGHGGVVIGSEISGGVNNVFAENCEMSSPLLERAIRIKTNSVRGGLIETVRVRNIQVGTVQNAIVIDFFYEEGDSGTFDPTVRDIVIENLVCENVIHKPLLLQGFERDPMSDIRLVNCHFNKSGEPSIVRHVQNLVLDNVTIDGKPVSVQELASAT